VGHPETPSATLAKDQLTQLRLEQVIRVASMFEERKEDLPVFLATDERRRKLASYLR
jgi:hypothetical protein